MQCGTNYKVSLEQLRHILTLIFSEQWVQKLMLTLTISGCYTEILLGIIFRQWLDVTVNSKSRKINKSTTTLINSNNAHYKKILMKKLKITNKYDSNSADSKWMISRDVGYQVSENLLNITVYNHQHLIQYSNCYSR